jgi:hypothetical protein
MEAKFYEVKGFTDPDIIHIVRHLENGEWRCDCWPFIRKGKCDHIRKVRHLRLKYHGRKAKKNIKN